MNRSDFRRHPVTVMLRHAALGELPRDADLDALNLNPSQRRAVSDHCRAIAAIRAGGENGRARDAAEEAAEKVLDSLPEGQQDPDYLKPSDLNEPSDPASLAARVTGW